MRLMISLILTLILLSLLLPFMYCQEIGDGMVIRGFVTINHRIPEGVPVHVVYKGATVVTSYVKSDGSFILHVKNLPNGSTVHLFIGNKKVKELTYIEGSEVVVTFRIVDETPPSSPKIVDVISGRGWLFIEWSRADDDIAVMSYLVELVRTFPTKYVVSRNVRATKVNITNLPPGIYVIKVYARDIVHRSKPTEVTSVRVFPHEVILKGIVWIVGPYGRITVSGLEVTAYSEGTLIGKTLTTKGGWYTLRLPGEVYGRYIELRCRDFKLVIPVNETFIRVDVNATDYTPPLRPANLTAKYIDGRIVVSWLPATDDIGISGYYVEFRSLVTYVNTTSTVIKCGRLIPGKYAVRVWAVDLVGNNSTAAVTYVVVPFPFKILVNVLTMVLVISLAIAVITLVLRRIAERKAIEVLEY